MILTIVIWVFMRIASLTYLSKSQGTFRGLEREGVKPLLVTSAAMCLILTVVIWQGGVGPSKISGVPHSFDSATT